MNVTFAEHVFGNDVRQQEKKKPYVEDDLDRLHEEIYRCYQAFEKVRSKLAITTVVPTSFKQMEAVMVKDVREKGVCDLTFVIDAYRSQVTRLCKHVVFVLENIDIREGDDEDVSWPNKSGVIAGPFGSNLLVFECNDLRDLAARHLRKRLAPLMIQGKGADGNKTDAYDCSDGRSELSYKINLATRILQKTSDALREIHNALDLDGRDISKIESQGAV